MKEDREMTATEPRRFGDGFAEITPPHELPDADFLAWMASYAEEHQPTGYPCVQTWEITRLVEMHRRLRISQLRRMEQLCISQSCWWRSQSVIVPIKDRRRCQKNATKLWKMANACLAEIERLRGEV